MVMNGYYLSVSNGLLEGEHRKKMGPAVWEFMWLLEKMTSISEEGIGKVLGGRPITIKELKDDLQSATGTISENLKRLKDHGYIDMINTGHGYIISVNKAKKVFNQKTDTVSKNRKEVSENRNQVSENPDSIYIQDKGQDNTLVTNVTNGETPDKVDNRNKDIQEGIELLRELNKSVTKENLNRYALKRLYKARGKERVIKAFRYATQWRQDDKYCPSIYNFMDLEDKWNQLEDYARNLTKGGKNGKESKHFDAAAKLRERRLESANSQEGVVLVSG